MPFLYQRTIQFRDTDAAGVVYFANVLSMCHEAYEASLMAMGISLRNFFGDRHRAIPIVHANVDFFQPLFCGDRCVIELTPELLKPSEFAITYTVYPHPYPNVDSASKAIAKALSRHVCIDPQRRTRLDLDEQMMQWITQNGH